MNRRRFLTLAPAFLAAPALVRATSIMPVRAVPDLYAMHNRYLIAEEVVMKSKASAVQAVSVWAKRVTPNGSGSWFVMTENGAIAWKDVSPPL